MDDRRRFLIETTSTLLASAGILSLASSSAEAQVPKPAEPKPAKPSGSPSALRPQSLTAVATATAECLRTGEACVAHCARELAAGNTAMAHCNAKVHDMLALCRAMLTLASNASPLAVRLAALCADACRDCAAACAEHKEHFAHGMHGECKACMESCLACEKACRGLLA
jgi:Cys-rich four helix bundle protein (predicted Tat secretion target)